MFMVLVSWQAFVRVHPVHLMNTGKCQAPMAADHCIKLCLTWVMSAPVGGSPPTPIAICYYSAQRATQRAE